MPILSTQSLIKAYGGKRVVNGVDISLKEGEIVGLLGPNGAGKTTSFNMIVGLIKPTSGKVFFDETDITNMPMYQRARMGIGYLTQEMSIFRKLTVEENILGILEMLEPDKNKQRRKLESLLDELKIAHLAKNMAYTLSGGERRRVEIARSLTTSPSFMLLDEPFSGVDPIAVQDLQGVIYELKKKGLGILITDHSVRETLEVTDRSYLLYEGNVEISGTAQELVSNERARKLYLGEKFYMNTEASVK